MERTGDQCSCDEPRTRFYFEVTSHCGKCFEWHSTALFELPQAKAEELIEEIYALMESRGLTPRRLDFGDRKGMPGGRPSG